MNRDVDSLILKAKKDKDVLAVAIFGSLARKEKNRDIDICIFLKPGKRSKLALSKKKLKYLSAFSDLFDIKIFQQLPLYLKHRVLKEGNILFCLNEDQLYDLAYLTAKEYEDFRPIHKSYMEALKHA